MWEVREAHHLCQELKGRRDYGLRRHDSCQNRNYQAEVETSRRHSVEEGICPCRPSRVRGDICCLADIGEQETWVRQRQPGNLDRALTESAQICKKCLDTSKGQENAAERFPPVISVPHQVAKGKVGAERLQHSIVMDSQVIDARCQVEQKPDCNDRSESRSELRGAEGLKHKQEDKDCTGNPNNGRDLKIGIGHCDALDSAQDGLGWREHAVSHDEGNA